jgi:CRISPR-associated endonuclease/helicase Cas3
MLRHEVLSGILALYVPSFRQWLESSPGHLMIAVWGAMGHHLKLGVDKQEKPTGEIATIPDGTGSQLFIYTQHPDFKKVLKMGRVIGLPKDFPELPDEVWTRDKLTEALGQLFREFRTFAAKLSAEEKRFIAAVKATIIASDIAGSALPEEGENLKNWIENVLSTMLTSEDLQGVITQKLNGHSLNALQKEVSKTKRRVVLVQAGCGTGKTIAAYIWGKNWAVNGRLFFCYPTTGTATQGYLDYAENNSIESVLMHSRSDLDRELLFTSDQEVEETEDRLISFQAWRKKLMICTVDSVLGIIQNNRKPLYSWPAIIQSAFVFDEAHAYDARLFGAMLRFIKAFPNTPILIMSASFTTTQLTAIQNTLAELGEELDEPLKGPKEIEQLQRYQFQSVKNIGEIWTPVLNLFNQGQKVLWVTNSVKSCIKIYGEVQKRIAQTNSELLPQVLIYHSRFRYIDRVEKHQQLIDEFRSNRSVLAITTQVFEMSLDINADLLVSAIAPSSALIQRLGRLNRKMRHQSEGTQLAIFYPWTDSKPYRPEDIKSGEQLIQTFLNSPGITQIDLAQFLQRQHGENFDNVSSAWIDYCWASYRDFLREGGYTVSVLLEQDLTEIYQKLEIEKQKRALGKPAKSLMQIAKGYSVSIRPHKNLNQWKSKKYYRIAPIQDVFYSEETGAENQ